jgi:hypothetical protein
MEAQSFGYKCWELPDVPTGLRPDRVARGKRIDDNLRNLQKSGTRRETAHMHTTGKEEPPPQPRWRVNLA